MNLLLKVKLKNARLILSAHDPLIACGLQQLLARNLDLSG